jgi:SAM-dependent methyltransferase
VVLRGPDIWRRSLELVAFLVGNQDVLSGLQEEAEPGSLEVVTRLRRTFDLREAAALVDLAVARRRARPRFADPSIMLFTPAGLEQATSEPVARHRARRFHGLGTVIDLGCGVGGDLRILGLAARRVVGVDIDPSHLLMARHNARLLDVEPGMVRADVAALPPARVDGVFADPARRSRGRRVYRSGSYSPPLDLVIRRWRRAAGGMAVKVAPGLAHAEIPPDAEAEFVSLDGDMKECTLWLGDLRSPAGRRATLLPAGHTLTADAASPPLPVVPVGSWLYEPDPAVIRAGLVSDLAAQTGLGGIDPTIAYLTGDRFVRSPFLRAWAVDAVMPFNLKRIKAHLVRAGIGRVVVKKRGSPVDPVDLARRLGGDGTEEAVVVVTRGAGRPTAIVCRVTPRG